MASTGVSCVTSLTYTYLYLGADVGLADASTTAAEVDMSGSATTGS